VVGNTNEGGMTPVMAQGKLNIAQHEFQPRPAPHLARGFANERVIANSRPAAEAALAGGSPRATRSAAAMFKCVRSSSSSSISSCRRRKRRVHTVMLHLASLAPQWRHLCPPTLLVGKLFFPRHCQTIEFGALVVVGLPPLRFDPVPPLQPM
jgi:hypothetical protein